MAKTKKEVTCLIDRSNRWERFIIGLLIVIIILLLIHYPPTLVAYGYSNTIIDGVCASDSTAEESLDCNDGNACTVDIKQRISTGCKSSLSGQTDSDKACQQYQCSNVPLAAGSCCNRDDFCYFDDPDKKCYAGGVCKSTDPTLCKGYCTSYLDCQNPDTIFPLQINTSTYPLDTQSSCQYNSCTQYLITIGQFTDPISMIYPNNGDMLLFNFSKCATVLCFQPIDYLNICTFNWNCAPYVGDEFPPVLVKRGEEDQLAINYSIPLVPTLHIGPPLSPLKQDQLNKFVYAKMQAFLTANNITIPIVMTQ